MVDDGGNWTSDELRTLAYKVGFVAEALGGDEQELLEQVENALYNVAAQLETV